MLHQQFHHITEVSCMYSHCFTWNFESWFPSMFILIDRTIWGWAPTANQRRGQTAAIRYILPHNIDHFKIRLYFRFILKLIYCAHIIIYMCLCAYIQVCRVHCPQVPPLCAPHYSDTSSDSTDEHRSYHMMGHYLRANVFPGVSQIHTQTASIQYLYCINSKHHPLSPISVH